MERIASFCVDHTKLEPGIYISRIDGDIATYDIRMRKPNTPPFLSNPVLHSFEHLFATIARNSEYGGRVIYFGPMGCRTGFYMLLAGDYTSKDVVGFGFDQICVKADWRVFRPSAREYGAGMWKLFRT